VKALKREVPDSDRYLADGSIEIVSSREWYLKGNTFSVKRVMRCWEDKLAHAVARGYSGMRANGNAAWLERKVWRRFSECERVLNESLAGRTLIIVCSYALQRCGAVEVLDVARTHHFAIAKRVGNWEVVEWRTPPSTAPDPYQDLTIREREVLLLAGEGLMNPEIAFRLSIGVRTVESHRARLMRKLGLRNQTDLVRYVLRRGLSRWSEEGRRPPTDRPAPPPFASRDPLCVPVRIARAPQVPAPWALDAAGQRLGRGRDGAREGARGDPGESASRRLPVRSQRRAT
jgi:DNA-binding CsgD family transcriptional regulator